MAKRKRPVSEVVQEARDASRAQDTVRMSKVIKELDTYDDDEARLMARQTAATLANMTGDMEGAIVEYMKLLELAPLFPKTTVAGAAYGGLGYVYSLQGDVTNALEALTQSLLDYERGGVRYEMAQAIGNISATYLEVERVDLALPYLYKALAIYEDLGDKAGMATELQNLGVSCNIVGLPRIALRYLDEAEQLLHELGHQFRLSQVYVNRAVALIDLQEFDQALKAVKKALTFVSRGDHPNEAAMVNCVMASCYLELGNPKKAGQILESIDPQLPSSLQAKLIRMMLEARIAKSLGNEEVWRTRLDEALAFARNGGLSKGEMEIHVLLRSAAEEADDAETFLKESRAIEAMNQQMQNQEAVIDLAIERAQQKIMSLTMDQDKERSMLYSSIPMLSSTLASIGQKVDDLAREIDQSLSDSQDPKAVLTRIKAALRSLNAQSPELSSLEAGFHKLHPLFLTELKSAYPSLSKQELRVCTFTRMNLSSVEIADMMNLSKRTVEGYRFSIRRKLSLPNEAPLVDILSKFGLT